MPTFNRVLIPYSAHFLNAYREGDEVVFDLRFDEHVVQHLLEEFIAVGMLRLVIEPPHLMYPWIDALSQRLRKLVKPVDIRERSAHKADAFLGSALSEFGIKSNYYWTIDPPMDLPDNLCRAFLTVCTATRTLITGIDYRVQIDIDIEDVLNAISVLRTEVRHSDARLNLAILEGVFSSYAPVDVDSIRLRSLHSDDVADHFTRLIEDASYQQLSSSMYDLGFLERIAIARIAITRKVRDIMRNPRFSAILDVASQTVQTPSPLSLPNSDAVKQLVPFRYLPPIVRTESLIRRASTTLRDDAVLPSDINFALDKVTLRMPQTPYWDAYHRLSSRGKGIVDSDDALTHVRLDGFELDLRSVRGFNTRLDSNDRVAEIWLASGLIIAVTGERFDIVEDALLRRRKKSQEIAYEEAKRPYGKSRSGFLRWTYEQCALADA